MGSRLLTLDAGLLVAEDGVGLLDGSRGALFVAGFLLAGLVGCCRGQVAVWVKQVCVLDVLQL